MINFQKKQLPNGLTVLTAPLQDTAAVTMLVLVRVGSRYETKEINGISHFLEHLFFKGTKKRPSTLKLSKELDTLGAKYNAFTGEEYTGFYVQTAGTKFKKAWDILSDMLLNPLIPEKEIERERGVILEEMNMYYDMPQHYVQELAKQAVYGDTPLGRDIIGTRGVIEKVQRDAIVNYRQKHYTPAETIVVIAGSGDEKSWLNEVEKAFSSEASNVKTNYEPAKTAFAGPLVNLHAKKTDQTHLVVNLPVFASNDKRWFALEVLSGILGGQMSSRLFLKIRERRGLAYYVKSNAHTFYDTGLLSISAGLKTSNVSAALKVIAQEFKNLRQKAVTGEELRRTKENIIGHIALDLEGSFDIAHFIGDQYFYHKEIKQMKELVEKYRAVTAADIMDIAKEFLQPKNMVVTAIGPLNEKDNNKFKKIITGE